MAHARANERLVMKIPRSRKVAGLLRAASFLKISGTPGIPRVHPTSWVERPIHPKLSRDPSACALVRSLAVGTVATAAVEMCGRYRNSRHFSQQLRRITTASGIRVVAAILVSCCGVARADRQPTPFRRAALPGGPYPARRLLASSLVRQSQSTVVHRCAKFTRTSPGTIVDLRCVQRTDGAA